MTENLRLDDLPLDDAARVRYIMAACQELERAMHPNNQFKTMAEKLNAKLAGLPGKAGRPVSWKSMERLYYFWKGGKKDHKTGQRITPPRCWQAVFDGRTAPANRQQVRTGQACFKAHLALLASRHPRSLTTAVKELYKEWELGMPVPGYEGLNPTGNEKMPAGWSKRNLLHLKSRRLQRNRLRISAL